MATIQNKLFKKTLEVYQTDKVFTKDKTFLDNMYNSPKPSVVTHTIGETMPNTEYEPWWLFRPLSMA